MPSTSGFRSNLLLASAAMLLISLGVVVGAIMFEAGAGARPAAPARVHQMRVDATRLFESGQFGRSEALLRELLRLKPDDPDARLLLAESLLGQVRMWEAYEAIVEGLAIRETAEAQFFAGIVASKIGRYDQALDHHARAEEMDPATAKYILYHGTALLNLDRIDAAARKADRAEQLDASSSELYLLRAKIAERRDDVSAALRQINRALERIGSDEQQYLSYAIYKAHLLRIHGRADQAVNLLLTLPAPDTASQESVVEELAASYAALGDHRKAAAAWVGLFLLEPHNPRFAAEAGLRLVDAGALREAHRYLGQARTLDSSHPAVKDLEDAIAVARRSAAP